MLSVRLLGILIGVKTIIILAFIRPQHSDNQLPRLPDLASPLSSLLSPLIMFVDWNEMKLCRAQLQLSLPPPTLAELSGSQCKVSVAGTSPV